MNNPQFTRYFNVSIGETIDEELLAFQSRIKSVVCNYDKKTIIIMLEETDCKSTINDFILRLCSRARLEQINLYALSPTTAGEFEVNSHILFKDCSVTHFCKFDNTKDKPQVLRHRVKFIAREVFNYDNSEID